MQQRVCGASLSYINPPPPCASPRHVGGTRTAFPLSPSRPCSFSLAHAPEPLVSTPDGARAPWHGARRAVPQTADADWLVLPCEGSCWFVDCWGHDGPVECWECFETLARRSRFRELPTDVLPLPRLDRGHKAADVSQQPTGERGGVSCCPREHPFGQTGEPVA